MDSDDLLQRADLARQGDLAPRIDLANPDLRTDVSGMVLVSGGTFWMGNTLGTDPEASPDEEPVHQVTLGPFYLDQTEVTVAGYRSCVDAGRCTLPDTASYCNWGKVGVDRHPINCVDWTQAMTYCQWLGKTLPTEEQWEYAARGVAGGAAPGSKYPWGNAPAPGTQLCWNRFYARCTDQICSAEVGSYDKTLFGMPTPGGLADLAGNVEEWTATHYCPKYDGKDCSTNYVTRGGGWADFDPQHVRAAYRNVANAADRFDGLGFRCALSR